MYSGVQHSMSQVLFGPMAPMFYDWVRGSCVSFRTALGDLNNFLMLLDEFFMYKEKAMGREQPFEVDPRRTNASACPLANVHLMSCSPQHGFDPKGIFRRNFTRTSAST